MRWICHLLSAIFHFVIFRTGSCKLNTYVPPELILWLRSYFHRVYLPAPDGARGLVDGLCCRRLLLFRSVPRRRTAAKARRAKHALCSGKDRARQD